MGFPGGPVVNSLPANGGIVIGLFSFQKIPPAMEQLSPSPTNEPASTATEARTLPEPVLSTKETTTISFLGQLH